MYSSRKCENCEHYEILPEYFGSYEGSRDFPQDPTLLGKCTRATWPFKQSCEATCSLHRAPTDWWLLDLVLPWRALARCRSLAKIDLDNRSSVSDTRYVLREALRLAWQGLVRAEEASRALQVQLEPIIADHTAIWREAAEVGQVPDAMLLPLEDDPRIWERAFHKVYTPAQRAAKALTALREKFDEVQSVWEKVEIDGT